MYDVKCKYCKKLVENESLSIRKSNVHTECYDRELREAFKDIASNKMDNC